MTNGRFGRRCEVAGEMIVHTFHRWPDDDSGKWLVLDENGRFVAGPFEHSEQADEWIANQEAINEWTDS